MTTKIFVDLPVQNLDKSIEFFKGLGFALNRQFTDETAACMVISDDIHAMLLTGAKFKEFTPKEIADATKTTEVLTCLSADSKDESIVSSIRRSPPARRKPGSPWTTVLCSSAASTISTVTSGKSSGWTRAMFKSELT
jgi:predicted lactoylglutathione lyase